MAVEAAIPLLFRKIRGFAGTFTAPPARYWKNGLSEHNGDALELLPWSTVAWSAPSLRRGHWSMMAKLPKEVRIQRDTRKDYDGQEQKRVSRIPTEIPESAQALRKETLDWLDRSNIQADSATYASLLRRCGHSRALLDGKRIHAHMIKDGHERDTFLGNLLVQMYGKCGALEDARAVFARMHQRNVFSWTIMIGAYVNQGHGEEALQLFQQMELEGVIPDRVCFVNILSACASQAALSEGKRMHACILGTAFESNIVIGNALINMYGKCGSLEDAQRMFDKMPERNVVSWNSIIAAYAQHGWGKEALQLFEQMQLEGMMPNKVTFASILDACASQAALGEGKCIHGHIVETGLELDIVVATALVNMYSKCGSLENARRMFDKMPEWDVVLWNAMLTAYVQHGQGKEALQLFQQMQLEGVIPDKVTCTSSLDACASLGALSEGKQIHAIIVGSGFESDIVVGTALVNMYGKCGCLKDAQRMFDKMWERNVVSWTAIIAAYAQHGHGKEALQLFKQMQLEGVIPNKVTFVSVLDACANQAALSEGKWMHNYILSSAFEFDVVVGNSLVNMYGKCGSLDDARRVFDKMSERDVVSWTAMIAAYSQHGQGKEAYLLFQQMQLEGLIPNKVTFISILSACSHAGLVDEGCHCFVLMSGKRVTTPTIEHYNCVIDILGRAGRLDEAEDLINNMPFEPNAMSWIILLSASRMHFDVERGKHAAEHVFELDPENTAPYALLSNIYASTSRWEDVANVRRIMEHTGLK